MADVPTGRFRVIREAFGYSVIDSRLDRPDRRVREFSGKTAREAAWAYARKRNRETLEK